MCRPARRWTSLTIFKHRCARKRLTTVVRRAHGGGRAAFVGPSARAAAPQPPGSGKRACARAQAWWCHFPAQHRSWAGRRAAWLTASRSTATQHAGTAARRGECSRTAATSGQRQPGRHPGCFIGAGRGGRPRAARPHAAQAGDAPRDPAPGHAGRPARAAPARRRTRRQHAPAAGAAGQALSRAAARVPGPVAGARRRPDHSAAPARSEAPPALHDACTAQAAALAQPGPWQHACCPHQPGRGMRGVWVRVCQLPH
jgi:hypothetical protein